MAQIDALPAAERNAREDLDNPPMTDAELARLRNATTVRTIRSARGMTQAVFAETYGTAMSRLRDWEQGRFTPDVLALNYLELIHRMPHAVEETIARCGHELRRTVRARL